MQRAVYVVGVRWSQGVGVDVVYLHDNEVKPLKKDRCWS